MIGMYCLKKMPTSVCPSIRAASMIAGGKFLELFRNIMIMNGVATCGRMKPHTEFSIPILEIRTNSGIMVATPGIIMASSRKANSLSLALSA